MQSKLIDFNNSVAKLSYEEQFFDFEDEIELLFLIRSRTEGDTFVPSSELSIDDISGLRLLNQYLTEFLTKYDERQQKRKKREEEERAKVPHIDDDQLPF